MAELGETQDPRELIPGRPEVIEENARVLGARAEDAGRAAEGLQAIDTGSWKGPAAGAFQDRFSYEPSRWFTAADSLEAGAGALDGYAATLRWAQGQAGEAIWLWDQGQAATRQARSEHDAAVAQAAAHQQQAPPFTDPGEQSRQAARETLDRARAQLREAGDIAAGILRGETEAAPEESGWLDALGHTMSAVGAHVVNGLASFGNALLHHPGEVLAAAGGIGLMAVSATGEVAGVALDATGVGAVAGVPLNAVSTAGIIAGAGITGAAVASIASHAAGDDQVSPVDTGSGSGSEEAGSAAGEPPKEITGLTEHGQQQALGRDGGRGVSDAAMHDAVNNPIKPVQEQAHPDGPTYKYRGRDAVVVLNGSGEVVTTYAKGSAGLRNP